MRTRFRAAALATFLVLSGCSAGDGSGTDSGADNAQPSCDPKQKPVKATVGFQPVWIPVKVTVNSEGDVDWSLAASWTTPAGTIDVDLAKNEEAAATGGAPAVGELPQGRPEADGPVRHPL